MKDYNECAGPKSPCGPNKLCTNTVASYACSCKNGYRVNNEGACEGNSNLEGTVEGTMFVTNFVCVTKFEKPKHIKKPKNKSAFLLTIKIIKRKWSSQLSSKLMSCN